MEQEAQSIAQRRRRRPWGAIAGRRRPWERIGCGRSWEAFVSVRRDTVARILEGIYPDGAPPKARTAVAGWLWFMDGACLNWFEHRDIDRSEMRALLLGVLIGALLASGSPPDLG